jgi:hypothetical protein
MDGTRVELLERLHRWSVDPASPPLVLLDGMAGTGKSAIARSFCNQLRENDLLGASFFCSRLGSADRRDAKRIIPTLAVSLCRADESYRDALLPILETEGISSDSNLGMQVTKLLEIPLALSRTRLHPFVLVVDALDECDGADLVKDLLTNLTAVSPSLPVKFFLTSRPEPHIRSRFLSLDVYSRVVLPLHNIDASPDISRYLTTRLHAVRLERPDLVPPNWPGKEDVRDLMHRAGNLFVYAFTAVEYIQENPIDNLRTLARIGVVEAGASGLDTLYMHVLQSAIHKPGANAEKINQILACILSAREPLSASTCAALLSISVYQLRSFLDHLHAVVHVPSDMRGPLSTFHASFKEFIESPERAGASMCIPSPDSNHELASVSFEVMRSDELHFNMSGCSTSYQSTNEQTLTEAPTHLLYACTHWAYHLVDATEAEDIASLLESVEAVFVPKFLFWVETFCLAKKSYAAANALLNIINSKALVRIA